MGLVFVFCFYGCLGIGGFWVVYEDEVWVGVLVGEWVGEEGGGEEVWMVGVEGEGDGDDDLEGIEVG